MKIEPGKPYAARDGSEREPYNVLVLLGSEAVKIEYPDQTSALAVARTAKMGEPIRLRVIVRAAGRIKDGRADAWLRYQGWVPRA